TSNFEAFTKSALRVLNFSLFFAIFTQHYPSASFRTQAGSQIASHKGVYDVSASSLYPHRHC
ncbi:MAG: hypothetical protein ACO20N_14085, partial [bacterium]